MLRDLKMTGKNIAQVERRASGTALGGSRYLRNSHGGVSSGQRELEAARRTGFHSGCDGKPGQEVALSDEEET